MSYFLKHYFNPDFNHLDIKPKFGAGDRVDHLNRAYVHNVVSGEVLAEWIEVPEEEEGAHDRRFLFEDKSFPMGPNCLLDPLNPDRLLAAVNGYVYYDADKRIAVKALLNIRRDVDYATGNISFVGDVVVHGAVRSGFSVKARNILVKGPVEGALLEATGSIQIESGVKGDRRAEIRAGGSIKVGFCENAQLSVGKNLLVEGSVMHCRLFVGHALVVKKKLIGGETVCRRMVHVGEQIGGGLNTTTSIVLGYDPALLQKIAELEDTIKALRRERELVAVQVARQREGAEAKEVDVERRIGLVQKQLSNWSERLEAEDFSTCAVISPGDIRPGVEISIGTLFTSISDFLRNVRVITKNNQVAVESPAEPRK